MYSVFMIFGFVMVYGVLTIIALLIYYLIKKTTWNPWFRLLAIVPFIVFWGLTYEPPDAIYLYAYEEVTRHEVPEVHEIAEMHRSPYDDFGDYAAFASFEVDPHTYQKIDRHFKSKSIESDSTQRIPAYVSEYLKKNPEKQLKTVYHYRKKGGLELYGATLDDKKTLIVFRSSW